MNKQYKVLETTNTLYKFVITIINYPQTFIQKVGTYRNIGTGLERSMALESIVKNVNVYASKTKNQPYFRMCKLYFLLFLIPNQTDQSN